MHLAPDLIADLAALEPRPDMGATIWRHPALVRRFYAPAVGFALTACDGKQRVLDVGCGAGSVALELARAGHAVTALDAGSGICAIARRTLGGTTATVVEARFGEDGLREGGFDAIRFGRSLHHLGDVGAACEHAALLLAPGGVVVVDEFCSERIEDATARWLAEIVASLERAGVAEDTGLAEPDEIVALWVRNRREHGLRTGEEMWRALEARFVMDDPAFAPYLWTEAAKHVAEPIRAELVARQAEASEGRLIDEQRLPGVAFRARGTVR